MCFFEFRGQHEWEGTWALNPTSWVLMPAGGSQVDITFLSPSVRSCEVGVQPGPVNSAHTLAAVGIGRGEVAELAALCADGRSYPADTVVRPNYGGNPGAV